MGFTNFNRQFIKNHFNIAEPITHLIKKQALLLDLGAGKGLLNTQKKYAELIIFQFFNSKKLVNIKTDISNLIIGAYLL